MQLIFTNVISTLISFSENHFHGMYEYDQKALLLDKKVTLEILGASEYTGSYMEGTPRIPTLGLIHCWDISRTLEATPGP